MGIPAGLNPPGAASSRSLPLLGESLSWGYLFLAHGEREGERGGSGSSPPAGGAAARLSAPCQLLAALAAQKSRRDPPGAPCDPGGCGGAGVPAAAGALLRAGVRARAPEPRQKWVGFTPFPLVSLLSLLPPSGWLAMRSLFVPSQGAAPDLWEEQCLLLSRVLAPELFGFAGNPTPLTGVLGVPNLGETGKGWISLLLFLPVLHPGRIHS